MKELRKQKILRQQEGENTWKEEKNCGGREWEREWGGTQKFLKI